MVTGTPKNTKEGSPVSMHQSEVRFIHRHHMMEECMLVIMVMVVIKHWKLLRTE
jgi:hypothetical protein